MEIQKLDIVNLIEQNPLIKLSNDYQSKFLEKVQINFTDSQQKLFVSSFYCYLNYNTKTDFVIELENIWKWLGFERKEFCKRVLTKHFTQDIDYKIFTKESPIEIFATQVVVAKKEKRGGYNKERILMTIHTFKKLCLKSDTKKANEIHDYFIKLEELTQETINEESNELKNQLLLLENKLEEKETQFEKEKDSITLNSFNKKNIVYFIQVDNFTIKFGETADIIKRYASHSRDYGEHIKIIYVKESLDKKYLETLIKKDIYIKDRLITREYNGENKTELIKVDDKFNIKNIIRIVNRLNDTIHFNTPDKREHDLEIKRLNIQVIEANTKHIEANNKTMSIKLEFKKLELQIPPLKEELDNEKLQEQIIKLTTENIKLTDEVTELRDHKAHRLIRNRGTKEEATKNKEKFKKWLTLNLIKHTGSFFKMDELMIKYLGRNTSTPIIKIYRSYLEEYIKEKYPDIRNTYIQKVKVGRIYMDLLIK
jgi:hypothetical protein